jgi:hypothetical protein
LVPVGDHATLRVAGIVAFLVMKSLAMHGRTNRKGRLRYSFLPGGISRRPEGSRSPVPPVAR